MTAISEGPALYAWLPGCGFRAQDTSGYDKIEFASLELSCSQDSTWPRSSSDYTAKFQFETAFIDKHDRSAS